MKGKVGKNSRDNTKHAKKIFHCVPQSKKAIKIH